MTINETDWLARHFAGRTDEPGGQPGPAAASGRRFLAASRDGDFVGLLALLDPDVLLRADSVAVQASLCGQASGAPQLLPETHRIAAVLDIFAGRAKAALPALVNGIADATWAPGGQPKVAFAFAITDGRIVGIDIFADPERLNELEVQVGADQRSWPIPSFWRPLARPSRR